VLGARFSRLAALAKVAVFKKGDAECSVQSTYHQGAETGFHLKSVCSNMCGSYRRKRKSAQSHGQSIAKKI
jgi:hypothetical protein